jgi:hypothetical protein
MSNSFEERIDEVLGETFEFATGGTGRGGADVVLADLQQHVTNIGRLVQPMLTGQVSPEAYQQVQQGVLAIQNSADQLLRRVNGLAMRAQRTQATRPQTPQAPQAPQAPQTPQARM